MDERLLNHGSGLYRSFDRPYYAFLTQLPGIEPGCWISNGAELSRLAFGARNIEIRMMRGVGEPEERFSPLPLGLLPSCNPNEPLWMQFPRQRNCEKKKEGGSSRSSGFHQKARSIRLSVNAVVVNLAVRRILAFPRNEGSATVIGHGLQNSRCSIPELGCDARYAQVLPAAYSKGLSMNDIA